MPRRLVAIVQSSSSANQRYSVTRWDGSEAGRSFSRTWEYECSCPAWTRNTPRKDCKHIRKVLKANIEGWSEAQEERSGVQLVTWFRRERAVAGAAVSNPTQVLPRKGGLADRASRVAGGESFYAQGPRPESRTAVPAPSPQYDRAREASVGQGLESARLESNRTRSSQQAQPVASNRSCSLCKKIHDGYCKMEDVEALMKAADDVRVAADPNRYKLLEVD